MFVNSETYKARMDKCGACPNYKRSTRSCGTILTRLTPNPDKVKFGRGEAELCGCVMSVKARLKVARCPVNKWQRDLTAYELREMKRVVESLEDKTRISAEERKDFYKVFSMVHGRSKKDENCKPCFLKELKEFINYYKKKDE